MIDIKTFVFYNFCMKNSKNKDKKVALITGASSGIGLTTAKMLKQKGYVVYGIARNPFETQDFEYKQCNVTDTKTIDKLVKEIFDTHNKIDLLVNCAGMGISGSVENSPNQKIEKIFDVNFFGTVNMCKAVLPYMRQNGSGHIVNISSVAGQLTIPFQTFYSATKAAIESFSTGLKMEVKPFGIKVACVLPGDTKTGFTQAREKNPADHQSYGDRIERSIATMEKDEQNGMTPESVAKVICKVANQKHPKILNVVGIKYKFFVFLGKVLPRRFVNKILYMMYAK